MGFLEKLKSFKASQSSQNDLINQDYSAPLTTQLRVGFALLLLVPTFFLGYGLSNCIYDELYGNLSFAQLRENHTNLFLGPIIFFGFLFVILKLLGIGSQRRLLWPYFYHPFVFYFVGGATLIMVIYNSLTGDLPPMGVIEQIKFGSFPFLIMGAGLFISVYWKK